MCPWLATCAAGSRPPPAAGSRPPAAGRRRLSHASASVLTSAAAPSSSSTKSRTKHASVARSSTSPGARGAMVALERTELGDDGALGVRRRDRRRAVRGLLALAAHDEVEVPGWRRVASGRGGRTRRWRLGHQMQSWMERTRRASVRAGRLTSAASSGCVVDAVPRWAPELPHMCMRAVLCVRAALHHCICDING